MIDTVGLLDCVTACFCTIVEAAGRDQLGWIVGRIVNPGFAPFPSFLLRTCNVDLSGSQTLTQSGDQATTGSLLSRGWGPCSAGFALGPWSYLS